MVEDVDRDVAREFAVRAVTPPGVDGMFVVDPSSDHSLRRVADALAGIALAVTDDPRPEVLGAVLGLCRVVRADHCPDRNHPDFCECCADLEGFADGARWPCRYERAVRRLEDAL